MSVEFYDCIIIETLSYCRRPDEPLNLIRDNDRNSCENNGGKLHSFSTLRSAKVNISAILHDWKSSVEKVEQYYRYRNDSRQNNDRYLCQCVQSGSFGRACEYKLPIGTTIDQTFEWKLQMKVENPNEAQEYGDIVCYKGVECNSGQLCLDWREICDGIQSCMFGYDENNCDILELNQCDDDEYRCMNGMCIPDEYFLDGQYDCLDWSDEIQFKTDQWCYYMMANVECDDRICPPSKWSCGDGQCIADRFEFQKRDEASECHSRREQYFICETHAEFMRWTMPNGRCFAVFDSEYEEYPMENSTEYEQCLYLLKCTLSQGAASGCPCRLDFDCTDVLYQYCSLDSIQYPSNGIMGPYTFFLFNRERSWNYRLPNWIMINGTINCRGLFISITETIEFDFMLNIREIVERRFCDQSTNRSLVENINTVDQCYRTNDSINICNDSRACLSIFRLKDGFVSCFNKMDEQADVDIEKTCERVKSHRLRCSIDQSTCLSVMALGNQQNDCQNKFDELWFDSSRRLSEVNCNEGQTDECFLLRQYIEQSWLFVNKTEIRSQLEIPFRWYCNSFWDFDSREDENINQCLQWWVCADEQWKCRTGQCIEQSWLSDDEWDCADASDEETLFYRRIDTLQQRNPNFASINESQSRFGICNKTHPFACLSLDTRSNRYKCLDFTQLGDGKIDCLGAIDERNTLKHCEQTKMLGYHFKCLSDNTCITYNFHCRLSIRCQDRTDDESWCFHRNSSSDFDIFSDFVCFDGKYVRKGRCNEQMECSFGEDEYMCDYNSSVQYIDLYRRGRIATIVDYRQQKGAHVRNKIHSLQLFHFPIDANVTEVIPHSISNNQIMNTFVNNIWSSSVSAYRCNRGLGVLSSNNSVICFCPPQYYGNYCQYHSDRFLFLLHLNLSQSIYSIQNHPEILLKVLILFFFENQVLMTNQFQVHPSMEMSRIYKKTFHFVYSHSSRFREERMKRYFNRSNILHSLPYSIRIELYEAQRYEQVSLIAVWQYSIAFDYLPVFRLAKVLRLTKSNPCLINPCHPNEQCQPLINDKSKYLCLCKSNFTGPNCSIEDSRCKNGFCASQALCKPDYQSLLRGNHAPYCICPFNRYGDRCNIEHDLCQSNSCLNGGTCLPGSTLDQLICLCRDDFYGSHCEQKRAIISLLLHNHRITYSAVVLQYFIIDYSSFKLVLTNQKIYTTVSSIIKYRHDGKIIPEVVVAKVYSSYQDSRPNLYLLSLHINTTSFEGVTSMSEENRCPSITQLSMKSVSPIEYHQICIKNSSLLCFHDNFYLCICNTNHTRVECFLYDSTLDRCSYCLTDGLCLRGNHIRSNDFLCLCPPCYSGLHCQFNSKSSTVTLDQLFYPDLISNHKQTTMNFIIIGSVFGFFVGLLSNFFSCVTLQRQACLQTGVGHYLLYMSIINQITLGFLTARLVHLSIIITDPEPFSMINNVLCKLLNYFLVCLTRISYWFTSFVSLERVYTVIFLNNQWFKKPYVARRLIALTLLVILLFTSYELIFVKLFSSTIENENSAMCVMNFPISYQTMWVSIHQTISIIHSILPLIINICSTTTIIWKVIKTKMNIYRTDKIPTATNMPQPSTFVNSVLDDRNTRDRFDLLRDVLNENKEMIARPMIALIPSIFSLFSLPIFIISLSLACQTDQINRLRYLLIVSYFISFIPQTVTFFLYIYPSTFYWKEWQSTFIMRGIRLIRQKVTLVDTTRSAPD